MKTYLLPLLAVCIFSGNISAKTNNNFATTEVIEETTSQQSSNDQLSDEELANIQKKLNNPLADLWLLFLQNDYTSFQDANDNNYQINSLKFQPVMSFDISKDYNLIIRPTIQHMSIEAPGLERESGLGDTGLLGYWQH
ncbi:hypothetical protein RGQ13_16980 [Thalassotalea psychrophila]|uniref:Uncharacterized protein n=1 Tax=Thalassotalea psychrophila TaxID=3065647 RepID=A0ABY9TSQ5_9GAMM|nr:hypothetical protein RGQ13_16980 [Colwelliaceae bacterium SQ149]